jgi:hypothetical protein
MSCRDLYPFALKKKVCSKNILQILLLKSLYQEASREVWKLRNDFVLQIVCVLRLFAP